MQDPKIKQMIEYIERAASKIVGNDDTMSDPVLDKIREWSRFKPKDSDDEIDMGNRLLGGISYGWVRAIYRRAQSDYKKKFPPKEYPQEELPLDGAPPKGESPPPLPKIGGADDPENTLPF